MTLLQFVLIDRKVSTRSVGKSYQSIIMMLVITLLMVGAIGARLTYLQLIQGERNRVLADKNRIRLIPKQPERGNIFDRKGKLLASTRLSRSVYLWPLAHKQPDWYPTLKRLSEIIEMPEADIIKRLERAGGNSPTLVLVARDITPAQIIALEENRDQLDGVEVEIEAVRDYPNGILAAHVLGYTGEINDEELLERKPEGYRLGDLIGKMGVEAAFEKELRGEWGGRQIEVDGKGKLLRILGEKPSKPGQNVQLTLDLELQKAAEKALGDHYGAVVALDPKNGAVLAMVSRPGFDPNLLSNRVSVKEWDRMQRSGTFLNRALRAFPPASTYKIITTSAALESGKYSPNTVLPTYASIRVGGITFADWNRAGFGPLGFPGAMAWSSDTFFYQVGMKIGGPTLIDWTRKYGFGKKTGIELGSEEATGLVADDAWKQRQLNEPWTIGDTVNMSIGQGFLLSTPVQVAMMFAVPANGGYLVQPHLRKDNEEAKSWRESLNMKESTIRVLHRGLRQVITGGTGRVLDVDTIPPVAGKSGTSEVAPGKKTHTWFGAYAPADKPEIVVVVFGEHSGGGGSSFAAPIVLEILEAYFGKKQPPKTEQAKPAAPPQRSTPQRSRRRGRRG